MNTALTQVSTQEYEQAREKARQAYRLLFKLSTKLDNFIWDNIHDRSEVLESLKQTNQHIEVALCILDAYDV
jgi:Tfp pilus assembly protein PilN